MLQFGFVDNIDRAIDPARITANVLPFQDQFSEGIEMTSHREPTFNQATGEA